MLKDLNSANKMESYNDDWLLQFYDGTCYFFSVLGRGWREGGGRVEGGWREGGGRVEGGWRRLKYFSFLPL
jgi:hypothetical protein